MTSAYDFSAFYLGDLLGDLMKVLGGSKSKSSFNLANEGSCDGRFWAVQKEPFGSEGCRFKSCQARHRKKVSAPRP